MLRVRVESIPASTLRTTLRPEDALVGDLLPAGICRTRDPRSHTAAASARRRRTAGAGGRRRRRVSCASADCVPRKDVLVTICATIHEDARKKVRTWHPVAVGVSRGGAHRPPFCLKRVEGNEQGKSNRA